MKELLKEMQGLFGDAENVLTLKWVIKNKQKKKAYTLKGRILAEHRSCHP